MIDVLRLNHRARNQLITLKRKTGIENWNVLCRWALCISLKETARLSASSYKKENAIEIAWRVFAGPHAEVYEALLRKRLYLEGKKINDQNLQECLRTHVHRGIGYLTSDRSVDSIGGLIEKVAAR